MSINSNWRFEFLIIEKFSLSFRLISNWAFWVEILKLIFWVSSKTPKLRLRVSNKFNLINWAFECQKIRIDEQSLRLLKTSIWTFQYRKNSNWSFKGLKNSNWVFGVKETQSEHSSDEKIQNDLSSVWRLSFGCRKNTQYDNLSSRVSKKFRQTEFSSVEKLYMRNLKILRLLEC